MRDPDLTKRARAMRQAMTEPEKRLWFELRAKRFSDVKFRRQKVIQDETFRAIVDFAANDPKLVIEVDGDTHSDCEAKDLARTRFLESKGYFVLRFRNEDVMRNLDGVLGQIEAFVRDLSAAPSPNPLP